MSHGAGGLLVAVLVLAACGSSQTEATITVTTVSTSTSTTSTTTAPAFQATTTTLDPTAVFEAGAVEALIDSIVDDLGIEDLGPVPVPDLTNPDPLVAMRELNAFSQWVHTNYPHPSWAQVITAEGLRARLTWEGALSRIFGDGARFVFIDEGWTWTDYELEPESGVSPAFRLGLPDGAVVIRVTQTFGDYDIRSLSDDEIISSHAGQGPTEIDLGLAPTEYGWQICCED